LGRRLVAEDLSNPTEPTDPAEPTTAHAPSDPRAWGDLPSSPPQADDEGATTRGIENEHATSEDEDEDEDEDDDAYDDAYDDDEAYEYEYDDEEDDTDADGTGPMAVVESYATEEEAVEQARLLVEHGIGASVAEARAGKEPASPNAAFRLEVLPIDVPRAERVLGFVEPDPDYDPADPPRLEKGPTPWKALLLIWLAAMIVVPVLAFLLTWQLSSR